jgi:uncharacterized caspase-like protein
MLRNAATAMLFGLLFLLTAVAAQAEKRVALVIGNSAYVHAPALANPVKDAQAMAAMFQKSGFDVVNAQYDVGNLQFRRAVRAFADATADSDIAVVYYAGHGIEIHGVNYLVPVDAKLASDLDADDEAITLERLVTSADMAKRLCLVILDASRESPFSPMTRQQRVDASRPSTSGLNAAEPTTTNTLIAYAAKAGSVAVNEEGDHSPYTAALLRNLFVPGLDIRLAFGRVRDEVLKQTDNRQEPFVYGALGGSTLALVPSPDRKSDALGDPVGEKGDYALVAKIGTVSAWQVFLTQHPTGFYADLAREHIAALNRAAKAAAAPQENTGAATHTNK